MRALRGLGAVLALATSVAACAAPPPTAAPTSPAAPTAVPTAGVNGRRAVHIDAIDAAALVMRFTDAQIFFDEEADLAAKQDGHPGGAPNPVWIRDLPTTGAFPIARDAQVTLLAITALGDRVARETDVATLVAAWDGPPGAGGWDGLSYVLVVVEDGRITKVEQPALP